MKPINVEIELETDLISNYPICSFVREVVVTFEVKSFFGFIRHKKVKVAIFPDTEKGRSMATKVKYFYKEEIEKAGWLNQDGS